MEITYLFQSGFTITNDSVAIVIDYYKDPKLIIDKILSHHYSAIYVLCSHGHYDHFNHNILDWKKRNKNIIYIFSKDILNSGIANENDAIYIDKCESFSDKNLSIKAFGSTDIGISFFYKIRREKHFPCGRPQQLALE